MVVVEDSVINVRERTYEMNTTNLTFSNLIKIDEKCFYSVSNRNPRWTTLRQTGCVTAHMGVLSGSVEEYCADTASKNSKTGRQIMEEAIHKVHLKQEIE